MQNSRNMKKLFYLAVLLLALPAGLAAQGTLEPLETDFRTRTSLALDYAVAPGLDLEMKYELRTQDNLSRIDRHQAGLDLTYKFNDWLKGGVGYTFFYRQTSSAWEPRHRADAHLTFSHRFGDWNLALREMLRLIHRADEFNRFQSVRNSLLLKSRLKLAYKGWYALEPYAFVELRNTLNDPSFSATWNPTKMAYSDYQFLGYRSVYVNRVRGSLGAEWSLSPHHALDLYVLVDYNRERDIDTNKDGTKLKSFTWRQSLVPALGIGYIFSF